MSADIIHTSYQCHTPHLHCAHHHQSHNPSSTHNHHAHRSINYTISPMSSWTCLVMCVTCVMSADIMHTSYQCHTPHLHCAHHHQSHNPSSTHNHHVHRSINYTISTMSPLRCRKEIHSHSQCLFAFGTG